MRGENPTGKGFARFIPRITITYLVIKDCSSPFSDDALRPPFPLSLHFCPIVEEAINVPITYCQFDSVHRFHRSCQKMNESELRWIDWGSWFSSISSAAWSLDSSSCPSCRILVETIKADSPSCPIRFYCRCSLNLIRLSHYCSYTADCSLLFLGFLLKLALRLGLSCNLFCLRCWFFWFHCLLSPFSFSNRSISQLLSQSSVFKRTAWNSQKLPRPHSPEEFFHNCYRAHHHRSFCKPLGQFFNHFIILTWWLCHIGLFTNRISIPCLEEVRENQSRIISRIIHGEFETLLSHFIRRKLEERSSS